MQSNSVSNPHLKNKRIRSLLLALLIIAALSLYVFNASRPGRSVEGCLQGCAVAGERKPGPLRLVSLNMLHGFPSFSDLPLRLALIAGEVQRLDADIVLLQEAPWTMRTGNGAKDLAGQLGYNYVYYRANGNRHLIFFEEGEAILSRFPLKDVAFTELQPRMGFFESRVSMSVSAITPLGKLSLFVVHLTDKDPRVREGQVASLKQFVETHTDGHAVVAGDFNSREDSPSIKGLSADWNDTFRTLHPADPGLTCCIDDLHAGPQEPLEERIDYIFLLPKESQVVSARKVFDQPYRVDSGWQWASDHIGLFIEIKP